VNRAQYRAMVCAERSVALLNPRRLVDDVLRRARRLAASALNLLGHDRETFARLAGASPLDSCVQREQVGWAAID